MKVELHCHSIYSKGKSIRWEATSKPEEIIKKAKNIGLDAIALTDHNTTKGWARASAEAKRAGILFIPGEEIDTKEGHIIALDINEFIKPNMTLQETLDEIKAQGGISIAPHPFDVRREGIGRWIKQVDVVEGMNAMCLDRISNWWACIQAKKIGKPIVCGSDAHTSDMLGSARNIITAFDYEGIIRAIKYGAVYIDFEYIHPSHIVRWTRERFARSYFQLIQRMAGYSRPKRIIASLLLKRFIMSDSKVWYVLARIGEGISICYSGLRFASKR
ncbi:MAG: CehA/McbA family metallohydrolase [Candidatus Aenigmatarchaeota archaeon]